MGIMNWQALAEQLRAIGVVVPAEREALTKSASARPVGESSARESGTPPAQPSIKPPVDKTCEVDASNSSEIEEVFNRNENPYFTHGDCIRWVLYDDKNIPIGRVAAFINNKTANTFEQPTGGMGFFECINDKEAALVLFDACKKWLMERGMKAMDGPINFGEKDRFWGLLSEGRDKPAIYTMNHHPDYYKGFFEEYGFVNNYEQIIYFRKVQDPPHPRLVGLADRVMRDINYRFETIKKSQGEKYI